jgi:hypothetical protein
MWQMVVSRKTVFFSLFILFMACTGPKTEFEAVVPSPDSKINLYFNLNDGEPYYLVYYRNLIVLDWSQLGFILNDSISFYDQLSFEEKRTTSSNIVVNQDTKFPFFDRYNELNLKLRAANRQNFSVQLRTFDGGIAFRYQFDVANMPDQINYNDRTEIDLYPTENRIWKYDSGQGFQAALPDTLSLPSTFQLDNELIVKVEEYFNDTSSMGYLVKRDPALPEFRFWSDQIPLKSSDDRTSVLSTPWRIIRINAINIENNQQSNE